jgi:hypothetical protein
VVHLPFVLPLLTVSISSPGVNIQAWKYEAEFQLQCLHAIPSDSKEVLAILSAVLSQDQTLYVYSVNFKLQNSDRTVVPIYLRTRLPELLVYCRYRAIIYKAGNVTDTTMINERKESRCKLRSSGNESTIALGQ